MRFFIFYFFLFLILFLLLKVNPHTTRDRARAAGFPANFVSLTLDIEFYVAFLLHRFNDKQVERLRVRDLRA